MTAEVINFPAKAPAAARCLAVARRPVRVLEPAERTADPKPYSAALRMASLLAADAEALGAEAAIFALPDRLILALVSRAGGPIELLALPFSARPTTTTAPGARERRPGA